MRICEAWGLAHAPLLPLPVLPSSSLAPTGGPCPCPLCSSISPESLVSGVVRVHVCVRGAQESCLVSVLCGQMKVGLFLLSLCFSLSFFLFPPHPHRTLPSTQTLISQISEKVGLFHFLSIYSSPTNCARQLGPAGLVSSLRLAPVCLPASWPLLVTVWASWQAGPGMGGQALCPACSCCLNPRCTVSACPLARLCCWSSHIHAWCTVQNLTPPLHPSQASCMFQVEF